MPFDTKTLFSLAALACLGSPPLPAAAQEVSITVSDAQSAAVASACSGGASSAGCKLALEELVAALGAANPGTTLATIIGSIASQVASMSNKSMANNEQSFSASASAAMLSALATFASSKGLNAASTTVLAVAENVKARRKIDLGAIASGAGLSVADTPASPA